MATKNGSPSTRPSSGGEPSVARDAANGHRPPEVKLELPEPGEIVTEPAHSQESPLDFSVKRKAAMGVYHESFTDDSQASSSAGSPPLQASSRLHGGSPATMEQPSPYSFGDKAGSSSPSGFHGLDFGQAARVREPEQPYISPAVGGFPPGMIPTNGSKMAFPNLSPILDPRRVHGGGSSKTTRPFKAYPREALSMPVGGMYMPNLFPLTGIEPSVLQNLSISTDELMTIYKQQLQLARERDKHIAAMARTSSMMNGASPRTTSGGSTSSNSSGGHSASAAPGSKPQSASPPRTQPQQQPRDEQEDEQQQKQLQEKQEQQGDPQSPPCDDLPVSEAPVHPSPLTPQRPMPPPLTPTTPSTPTTPTSKSTPPLTSPFADIGTPSMVPCASSASATLVSSTSCSSNARKRPRTLPDDQKDDAYWERRRKNNEAAKRSRDARRAKEDEIAIRAALLEQENLKLRVEVAALKNETARLRCLLYNS